MEKWTHGLQSWNLVIFRIEPAIKRSIVFLYPSHFRKIDEKEPRYNETSLSEHILPPFKTERSENTSTLMFSNLLYSINLIEQKSAPPW